MGALMKKPESFPFLRIAKKYDVSYADVLEYAQAYRDDNSSGVTGNNFAALNRLMTLSNISLITEIYTAIVEQDKIRLGLIDWNTGELK